jgi:hypothetical protein
LTFCSYLTSTSWLRSIFTDMLYLATYLYKAATAPAAKKEEATPHHNVTARPQTGNSNIIDSKGTTGSTTTFGMSAMTSGDSNKISSSSSVESFNSSFELNSESTAGGGGAGAGANDAAPAAATNMSVMDVLKMVLRSIIDWGVLITMMILPGVLGNYVIVFAIICGLAVTQAFYQVSVLAICL